MKTIGLTGGIATGKSTVAQILRTDHELPVIDADQVARDVVAPGSSAILEIRDVFGEGIFLADGSLDRPSLRRLIANDDTARTALEAITHPRIVASILEQLSQLANSGQPMAFVEAALLVETGSYAAYDWLWVVTCPPEMQLQRLMARDGCSQPEAAAMISTQLPLAHKEALADYVLPNASDRESLKAVVNNALLGIKS